MPCVVFVGISVAFTPTDLEALVITAAEAVHGQPDDLSSRQRELAARAYALLQDAIDDVRNPSETGENLMRFVAPPTHVGEDQWPVLYHARLNTDDDPAEFIVLVDCGEGTPEHPYATLRVHVSTKRRTRRRITDGKYNLTFDAARRSLAERAGLLPTTASTIEVVVVGDPDFGTEYATSVDGVRRPEGKADGVRVVTHDIDLGTDEITPASVEQLQRADALSPAAARHARDAVLVHVDDIDCGDGRAHDAADDGQAGGGTGAAGPEARQGAA